MPLAVILDMDGVMLDTEPISLRVWKEAAGELGYDLDDATCERMIGVSQAGNRAMLLEHFGSDCPVDDLARLAQERYRVALAAGVPRKPDLLAFIEFLNAQQLPRAVATSTDTSLAMHKLREAGVLQHFAVLVGGDQVARGKPEPDIFLAAAARLGQAAADCVVLEDSAPGVRAALAAGMKPILIPDLCPPGPEVRRAAYAVAASLLDARAIIDSLRRK